ncbi:MAG: Co2+/Mg2+ efflux protein ApaG [Betaproteobacteria bacterium]|jgi:ApaG protein
MPNFSLQVSVKVEYLEEQSNPDQKQYNFAYTITIKNESLLAVQVIARQWLITDAEEKVQEVRGLGVVGQQPLLKSGEQFQYTSWASLPTPVGSMKGIFFCISEEADLFEVMIQEFALAMPRTLH